MIVQSCPTCSGYTHNLLMTHCPVDGTALRRESVAPEVLAARHQLGSIPANDNGQPANATLPSSPLSNKPNSCPDKKSTDTYMLFQPVTASQPPARKRFGRTAVEAIKSVMSGIGDLFSNLKLPSLSSGTVTVTGKIKAYSQSSTQTNGYRRLPWTKLWQAVRYRQRTEDVLHRFVVVNDSSDNTLSSETIVNAHGIIGSGASLSDHETVMVTGRYSPKTKVLYAQRITVLSHGGNYPITFQRSVKGTIGAITIAILALILIPLIFQNSGNGQSCQSAGDILTAISLVGIVLFVLSLIAVSSSAAKSGSSGCARKGCCSGIAIGALVIICLIAWLIYAISSGQLSNFFNNLLAAIEPFVPSLIIIIVLVSWVSSYFKKR